MKMLTWILSGITGFIVAGMGIAGIGMIEGNAKFVIYIPVVILGVFVVFANFKQFISIKPDKKARENFKKSIKK